jgi:hypothetical protein
LLNPPKESDQNLQQVTCRAAGGMPIVVPSDEWSTGAALVLSEPSVWKVANVSWNDGFNYYDLQELRDQCGCSGTDYLDACMQAEKALHGRVNEALMRRGIEDPEPACPGLDSGDLMSMSEEQLAERDAINAIYGQQFHDVKNELMADEELYLESRGLGGDSYAIQGATHEALAHRNLNTDSDDDEFKWPDDGGPALMDYASGPKLQARLEWFARRDDALRVRYRPQHERDDAVQHPDGCLAPQKLKPPSTTEPEPEPEPEPGPEPEPEPGPEPEPEPEPEPQPRPLPSGGEIHYEGWTPLDAWIPGLAPRSESRRELELLG